MVSTRPFLTVVFCLGMGLHTEEHPHPPSPLETFPHLNGCTRTRIKVCGMFISPFCRHVANSCKYITIDTSISRLFRPYLILSQDLVQKKPCKRSHKPTVCRPGSDSSMSKNIVTLEHSNVHHRMNRLDCPRVAVILLLNHGIFVDPPP